MIVGSWAMFIVLGITVLLFMAVLRQMTQGGTRREDQAQETQLMQELHQGLSRMEQRIEALETLLLDRTRGK